MRCFTAAHFFCRCSYLTCRCLLVPTNLCEHRPGQFPRFHTGVVVGQHSGCQAANSRASLLRRVMLRKRGTRQFFFQMR